MDKIKPVAYPKIQGITMSSPTPSTQVTEIDPVEAVVSSIPLVLPLAGAVLIFLLAFIAVSMA
ncbi:MAG: hypothetical protein PHS32_21765 [Rhodoferax sp.]|nr:hypothetical protein [Rhodoferax sp.]